MKQWHEQEEQSRQQQRGADIHPAMECDQGLPDNCQHCPNCKHPTIAKPRASLYPAQECSDSPPPNRCPNNGNGNGETKCERQGNAPERCARECYPYSDTTERDTTCYKPPPPMCPTPRYECRAEYEAEHIGDGGG